MDNTNSLKSLKKRPAGPGGWGWVNHTGIEGVRAANFHHKWFKGRKEMSIVLMM